MGVRFEFELQRLDGKPNAPMRNFAEALQAPSVHYIHAMPRHLGIMANAKTGGVLYTGLIKGVTTEDFKKDMETVAGNTQQSIVGMKVTPA